jgi:hypothetical protein
VDRGRFASVTDLTGRIRTFIPGNSASLRLDHAIDQIPTNANRKKTLDSGALDHVSGSIVGSSSPV